MIPKSLILVGVVLGILLLALPASAEIVNLSQPYASGADFHLYEHFISPLESASTDSAIMWITFSNIPTTDNIVFTVTFNDLTQQTGSIVVQDTSPISSTVTLSLGGIENTTTFNHLPLIGIAPRYALTYGVDPSGYHYLVLLPVDRTGGSPWDGKNINLDTDRDPHVVVNPPVTNPIIRFEKTSSAGIFLDGFTATMDWVQNGKDEKTDWISMFLSAVTGGLGILSYSGGFLVKYAQYIPLAMLLGEALLFLNCIDKKKDIVSGIGLFVEKNLYFADIVQRILSYVIDALYQAWDAFVKWI